MASPTITAPQHDFSKLAHTIGGFLSSVHNSITFARLCEAEWNNKGNIDAAALARICRLADLD